MIASGEKKEEYRYLSHYFCRRLTHGFDQPNEKYGTYDAELVQSYSFKKWDSVEFINGYSKTSPRVKLKFEGLEINTGNPEWGAAPGIKYFVIKLGDKMV